MNHWNRTVALLLLSGALVCQAEDLPIGEVVAFDRFDASAAVTRYDLVLERGDADQLVFHVWMRGDQAGQAWAESSARPAYALGAVAGHGGFYGTPGAELVRDGDSLRGRLYRTAGSQKEHSRDSYHIDARISGDRITGSYLASEWREDQAVESRGPLTGAVLDEAALKKVLPPVSATADYPCWRNDGSGSGPASDHELVRDPSQARLLWKSEALIPAGYYEGSNIGKICDIQSGHASPVLAGGRLYLHYFVGDGPSFDAEKVERGVTANGKADRVVRCPPAMWQKKFAERADQLIVCIDAQTGRTLWQTCFDEAGPNIAGWKTRVGPSSPNAKAASHLTPCVDDGRVFAKGTGGTLYALDAATGDLLWQEPGFGLLTDTCIAADGVVATGSGSALIGLDARTGERLWQIDNATGSRVSHIRHRLDDRWVFIAPRGQCIEARSGRVLWQADPCSGVLAAGDGHMVSLETAGKVGILRCWRIDQHGMELVWQHRTEPNRAKPRTITPVIWGGHVFARLPTPGCRNNRFTLGFELASGRSIGQASGTKSFSSPSGGDDRLFNGNAAVVLLQDVTPGSIADLAADTGRQQKVADAATSVVFLGAPETTPIYADGRLYSRTFDGIVCYDLRR